MPANRRVVAKRQRLDVRLIWSRESTILHVVLLHWPYFAGGDMRPHLYIAALLLLSPFLWSMQTSRVARQFLNRDGSKPPGYTHVVTSPPGRLVFISGQGPIDPETGEFRFGSFAEQAKLTFDNVTTLLEAAGTSWQHVVKVSVFLANLTDFGEMNKIYKQYLTEPYPARTTVQVVLPPKMLIEVDCVAVIPQNA